MLASLIANLASGETALAVRRARFTAICYVLAGLAALCGLGFLLGAFYIWLARWFGPVGAALWIGGGFLMLSIAILMIHSVTAGVRARRAAKRRKSDMTAVGIAAALAVVGYAIYRENTGPKAGPGEPDE